MWNAFVGPPSHDGIEVIVVAMGDHDFHALARFPDHRPRHWIGRAKKHGYHVYCDRHRVRRRIWAVRCKCEPIGDRGHQVNTAKYVFDHWKQGHVVWRIPPPNGWDAR